jgi:hypothetical protein
MNKKTRKMPKYKFTKLMPIQQENSNKKKIKILSYLINYLLLIILFIIPVIYIIIPYFNKVNVGTIDMDFVRLIIETATVVTGFGMLAFQINRSDDFHWKDWFNNLRNATCFSLFSVVLGFYYIISSKIGYFLLSVVCLYASIVLIFLFVIFHKSKIIF